MSHEFGDVVLVPFPFTDQSQNKKRPAVVVSSTLYNRQRPDLVLMAITSQVRSDRSNIGMEVVHWKEAGLLKASSIKPVFTTIEKELVLQKLGKLSDDDLQKLRNLIPVLLG